MPKKVVSQKQRQKQSVTVNISLAKAKARAKAKKSRGKRSSVMMLPPPIYASPINNLIPAMYGSQGQQIQPKSTEELLKSFLSKSEPEPVKTWNTLGSSPALTSLASFKSLGSGDPLPPYMSSSSDTPDWVSELSTPSILSSKKSISTPSTRSGKVSSNSSMSSDSLNADFDQKRLDYFRNKIFKETGIMPTPFQNEERTYLKASEPDNESTAPKFSDKSPESFYEMLNRLESETQKEINNLEPRRPDRRPPVRIPFEDESSVSSLGSYQLTPPRMVRVVSSESQQSDPLNPFPEKMYNKMMGYF